MQQLNFYGQLLENEKQRNPQAAEYLEEEIDILIHKLKYIHQEIRPTVLILQQAADFSPLFNEQLHDVIAIAGGVSIADKMDNPSIICIVQEDESLLSTIFNVLQDDVLSRSNAVQKNQIYIIQKENFATQESDFLKDVEICAEIVQPKYFIYGHQGTEWLKFDIA